MGNTGQIVSYNDRLIVFCANSREIFEPTSPLLNHDLENKVVRNDIYILLELPFM